MALVVHYVDCTLSESDWYSYSRLVNEFLGSVDYVKPSKCQLAVSKLYTWFCGYGMSFWNGECFQSEGFRIYPVFSGDFTLLEIRFD